MKQVTFESESVSETKEIAQALGGVLAAGAVVSLTGDLGAGKTNFVQGVAEALEIHEPITSPTFNLVFEYREATIPLFHFDLYRIEDRTELDDIDFYYLTDPSSEGVSFVEWADKFPDAMPEDALEVHIACTGDTSRRITARAQGTDAEHLLDAWEAEMKHAR